MNGTSPDILAAVAFMGPGSGPGPGAVRKRRDQKLTFGEAWFSGAVSKVAMGFASG